jgi:hypothetical protein
MLKWVIKWVVENKEWLFGGAGLACPRWAFAVPAMVVRTVDERASGKARRTLC